MKANHNKFGKVEILSIIDNNIIEVKLSDGSTKKLPVAFTVLTEDNGNKIADFSNVKKTTSASVVHEIKSDEEVNAWKNRPVEMIELKVIRETEKAVAIEATSNTFNYNNQLVSDTQLVWIPKSMVKDGKAPKWYVDNKIADLTVNEKGIFKTYSI